MTVYRLFSHTSLIAWEGNARTPDAGDVIADQVAEGLDYNVLYKRIDSFSLDDGDTETVDLANKQNVGDWVILLARIRGTARLETAAKDTDDATDINGYFPGYGNNTYPGIVHVSTYNLSTLTIRGQADGTKVELFVGIACDDDDSRYSDNA